MPSITSFSAATPKVSPWTGRIRSGSCRSSTTGTPAANARCAYHGLTFWSPNVNIFRDPRWGRGQETYGEDPYLTGRTAVAFIRGLQGDDPRYLKLAATAKHFAVHSGPESSRHHFDARISARDLRETYLPAFRMAVREGKVASIMGAYNRVDGVPACTTGGCSATFSATSGASTAWW